MNVRKWAGLALLASLLTACAPPLAEPAASPSALVTPSPIEDRPVTDMLAAVTLNGANEADALAIANGLCLRLGGGWTLADAGAEWVAVGWDAALVDSVAASVDAHPLFCETMAPVLGEVTLVE